MTASKCDQLLMVATSPAENGKVDWQDQAKRWKELIIPKLNKFGFKLDEEAILVEEIQTPLTFANRDGNYKGSLFGLSEKSRGSLGLPPSNRDEQIENLFYCGATTQPGAGMPMACLSGSICVRILSNYLRKQR